ncbi:hypothetical protein NST17_13840 [Caldifermentibacillus hisashii]|uniref:Uncharacterized protein n=1 Tax=Caldifermentibacillus hisashii TaxID=996558 RepID=A0ABU9JZK7_9BACI
MATRPLLTVVLNRKTYLFGDETFSRHHFEPKIARFWRRGPFSSPFWGGKYSFLATKPFLVTILGRKTHFFGDEAPSRRRFEPENLPFWRRYSFSSPFWGGKCSFLTTKPFLVTILGLKTHFFGDETFSRRVLRRKTYLFGDETTSRRRFEPENPLF